MGVNPNDVLLETWKLLDAVMAEIKSPHTTTPDWYKAQGRAYANVLATFMPPFFDDPDEIVREALRRYDNRDNPEYETPGLGVKFLAQFDKPKKYVKEEKRTGNKLPDTAIENIKKAIESGMFTVDQIATNYKVSPAEVKEQLGLV
jgi:hypothetical protein